MFNTKLYIYDKISKIILRYLKIKYIYFNNIFYLKISEDKINKKREYMSLSPSQTRYLKNYTTLHFRVALNVSNNINKDDPSTSIKII